MKKDPKDKSFLKELDIKIRRRRKGKARNLWFGLGMFGLVGWSVAIPTLAGVAIGLWLDLTFPGKPLWTIMLMIAGVITGSLNAWYWIQKELNKNEDEE